MKNLHLLSDGVTYFNVLHEVEDLEDEKQTIVALAENKIKVFYTDGFEVVDEYHLPFPFKDKDKFLIKKIDGYVVNSKEKKLSLFIFYLGRYDRSKNLVQVNIERNRVISSRPIFPIHSSKNEYLGLVDTKVVTYSDQGVASKKDNRGLVYIDLESNNGQVQGAYVKLVPIYLPSELSKFPYLSAISEEDRDFIVVDTFSSKYPIVAQLPKEFKEMESDFSTGLIKLSF